MYSSRFSGGILAILSISLRAIRSAISSTLGVDLP
jgi:hypothetical protein